MDEQTEQTEQTTGRAYRPVATFLVICALGATAALAVGIVMSPSYAPDWMMRVFGLSPYHAGNWWMLARGLVWLFGAVSAVLLGTVAGVVLTRARHLPLLAAVSFAYATVMLALAFSGLEDAPAVVAGALVYMAIVLAVATVLMLSRGRFQQVTRRGCLGFTGAVLIVTQLCLCASAGGVSYRLASDEIGAQRTAAIERSLGPGERVALPGGHSIYVPDSFEVTGTGTGYNDYILLTSVGAFGSASLVSVKIEFLRGEYQDEGGYLSSSGLPVVTYGGYGGYEESGAGAFGTTSTAEQGASSRSGTINLTGADLVIQYEVAGIAAVSSEGSKPAQEAFGKSMDGLRRMFDTIQ